MHSDNDVDVRRKLSTRMRLGLQVLASLSLAGIAIVPTTMATASAATKTTNVLYAGSALEPGQSLLSNNGEYRLLMQRDGNLVLYKQAKATWSTGTEGHPGALADLQRDGNFVIYDGQKALWESGTDRDGGPGNHVVAQDDGNLVIYNGASKALWCTYRQFPATVQLGDSGWAVSTLQRQLNTLHYWLGPQTGYFGDSTQQAVWALQKAAGLPRTGIVGPATWSALDHDVMPVPRAASGNLIEVNLSNDLLMIIRQGKLWATLNTSTGGGYTYTSQGVTSVAITPQGVFSIYRVIDGSDTDALGTLWRPRFFTGGYAIHGDGYVPPEPVSHGCVRVSDEAIDWIWADNVAPLGSEVWVF